jgi:hypothetical protein
VATTKQTTPAKSVNESDGFPNLSPPADEDILRNVRLVFAKNIPEDVRQHCTLKTKAKYPETGDETEQKNHLVEFVSDRLEVISRYEYTRWLNGRLPFVTPRELLIWRLRQYVEYIWGFQLPADDDLAMIFNTTKMRAAALTADFTARFRKSLLFPIALQRLYRILRQGDPNYPMMDHEIEYNKDLGPTFKVPSSRYVQDANTLIEEYRLRGGVMRNAALVDRDQDIMWVSNRVIEWVSDDDLKSDLLNLYQIPKEGGYAG